MRRNIELYIAGQKVDMNDNTFLLFNYTLEDLSNPTIVKNSFSKSITLPGTANNNDLFGHISRVDRVTQYDEGYTGANFDVMRRTPFVIYNERGEIEENGYMKLDKVSVANGKTEYQVTLFGGLGSFFYSLMYNADGSKMTLADMRYKDYVGSYTRFPGLFGGYSGYDMLRGAWAYLADPEGYDFAKWHNWWGNIINFAPCYNGLPEEFSADKAVVTPGYYGNIPNVGFKGEATSNLMVFTNAHDEWEMKDLRWYLQRPVFRLRSIIEACCDKENNGGYEVQLSPFFSESNKVFNDTWLTLPMIAPGKRDSEDAVISLLSDTLTPADYLISFAKLCGLVFVKEVDKICIMHRSELYAQNASVIDLTGKVDISSVTITPHISSKQYYQFGGGGGGAIGATAEEYKAQYKRDYGIRLVNTGNEFDLGTSVVTEDIVFKDAVELQQRSLLYRSPALPSGSEGVQYFALPLYEKVILQGWQVVSGTAEMTETSVLTKADNYIYVDNPSYPTYDMHPRMQFHDKDNKAVDGSNVLVYFNGFKQCPYVITGQLTNVYRLTDDHPDMVTLNELPCWNFTNVNSEIRTSLPSFRRCITQAAPGYSEWQYSQIMESLDWGDSLATYIVGYVDGNRNGIYERFWKRYQEDRYDDDTMMMSCKVDLSGMQVGQPLLGRFFYYEGAVFVLNAINNYSMTTFDDVECEFVKVNEIRNYKEI